MTTVRGRVSTKDEAGCSSSPAASRVAGSPAEGHPDPEIGDVPGETPSAVGPAATSSGPAAAEIVRIQPARGQFVPWRDLWRFRDLLYFLAWRDVKVRYSQTALGLMWAVLQPALMMVVFSLVFGRFTGMPSDGMPYPVFVYCALVPWTYLSSVVATAGNSLVGSSHLITKVYFPRLIIPAAPVASGLLDLGLSLLLTFAILASYGISPGWRILLLPCFILLTACTAMGIGLWLSALNVQYRDVRYLIPFLVQLWFFVTPIVYPLSAVPEPWRTALALNPMTAVVEGFRSALTTSPLDARVLAEGCAVSVLALIGGMAYFRRVERTFADII
jgi:lipopolysaccharide transport system permease protein